MDKEEGIGRGPEASTKKINAKTIVQKDLISCESANKFLTLLDENAESFTFQTFADKKLEGSYDSLAKIFHGSLEDNFDKLVDLQLQGAGVFVTINQTNGKGRTSDHINKVRACFVDLDGSPLDPILRAPVDPHIIIESSPGRFHAYWLIEDLALENFRFIQECLAKQYNGDKAVIDLPRVMRLPGFFHQKKDPFLTKIFQESGALPISGSLFLDKMGIDLSHRKQREHKSQVQFENNLVLQALNDRKMIKEQKSNPQGCYIITCPWENQHTSIDKGTCYYEPGSNGFFSHGFKCFHSHCKNQTTLDLLKYLEISNSPEIEPIPLNRHLASFQPFPVDALGATLEEAVKVAMKIIQAPDAICAQSFLSAANLAVMPHRDVLIDGRIIPLSEFFVTIAETGDRKTGIDRVALKPIVEWEKMHYASFRAECIQYENEMKIWEKQRKDKIEKINDSSCLQDELRKLGIPKQPPLEPVFLCGEPTLEGITKLFQKGQPALGLFSDEGGKFLGGFSMGKENILKTAAGLSSLWDGSSIDRVRSGDGSSKLFGRRLALHLMIQPVLLPTLINSDLLLGQGLISRLLISFPETLAGTRLYREENIYEQPEIIKFYDKMNSILDRKLPVGEPPYPQNELNPPLLRLTLEAKHAWIDFHNSVESKLGKGQDYRFIKGFACKAAEHALRLGATLQLLEDIESQYLTESYLKKGIRLTEFYLNEALRICGYAYDNPELRQAHELLEWLLNKLAEGHERHVPLSFVVQYGPPALRNAEKARQFMRILEKHRYLFFTPNTLINGKMCREVWWVRPIDPEIK
ncbi:hypothetical protein PNK_2384 [Candidatus Protochlamydia naegleriophila]|uniref:RepB-like DNA primase domain-containing protein n=1 Tax=Candidatus Protochlamydia naegleriophila TaxID=389348 RepID=A0A0U5CSH0_9BACT|nr:DUF3987 domain-containing protein [Candidatus Protochlamydia naegleriophila]CUI17980.1 hypothetical protein PNK_2384 [Candidatus Protochlamydia naegleriophila]